MLSVNKEFLKYRNLFKKPTNPTRRYPKQFRQAFLKMDSTMGSDYIDRDYFEEEVIAKTVTLEYENNLSKEMLSVIPLVTDYFECRAICTTEVYIQHENIAHTVNIVGFRNDVLIATHILDCLINGYALMKDNLQRKYRNGRERQRKRRSFSTNYINARTRANVRYTGEIINTRITLTAGPGYKEFGVVHKPKMNHLDKQILNWFKLNYKYPNAKEHKIEHAFVKNKWVQNRILIK
jgi:hypothetical protein